MLIDASLFSSFSAAENIREIIPKKYRKRYLRWKREYLSTEAGREQWERYARDPQFVLSITVSPERGYGAEVSDYRWNEAGKLVAATIILGDKLDKGYPAPINYPVTSALALTQLKPYISGEILAATKLAHEFGHINQRALGRMQDYLLQQEYIPLFNQIFQANGRNARDPRLLELARRMGGTPVEIAQDREHWAEANALRYLRERIPESKEYGAVFRTIKVAIEEHAQKHIERFR